MTALLMRKILLSLATLHTMYVMLVLGVYTDLTDPIRNTWARIIFTTLAFCGGLLAYEYFATPEALREILPMQSAIVKSYIISQVIPLVAHSIRLMGAIAILISTIDKLMFIVSSYRVPYLITLATVVGMSYIGGMTMYTSLVGVKQDLARAIMHLEIIQKMVIPPMVGITLFLLACLMLHILQATIRKLVNFVRPPIDEKHLITDRQQGEK